MRFPFVLYIIALKRNPREKNPTVHRTANARLDYQKKSNRDLYEADYLMLGGLETVNENIKSMRAKVSFSWISCR